MSDKTKKSAMPDACGACRIKLYQGEIRLRQPIGMELPVRPTLTCCAVPASDMEIVL